MASYRVVSSDQHIFEPADLWTSRIEPKYRERCPQIKPFEDGEIWVCDGRQGQANTQGTQAGLRFEHPEKINFIDKFENVRLGGYIPEEYMKDMDMDGVDVGIIYPSVSFMLYGTVPDGELLSASFRVYNDWLAEFCSVNLKRLGGVAVINVDDVHEGIREMERCRKIGLITAMIPVAVPEGRSYDQPEYEPLWAAAQDLDMPIGLHAASNRIGSGQGENSAARNDRRLSLSANFDHHARVSIADMIFSGVFERYPKLQVGSVEHEVSWAAHFIDRIDYNYMQRPMGIGGYRFKEDMLPSDYFRRNVFIGFQEDSLGIRLRDIIGVDLLQWGSDYPHQESTFPRSQEILEEILVDCTEEEKAKIVGGNAARVYKM